MIEIRVIGKCFVDPNDEKLGTVGAEYYISFEPGELYKGVSIDKIVSPIIANAFSSVQVVERVVLQNEDYVKSWDIVDEPNRCDLNNHEFYCKYSKIISKEIEPFLDTQRDMKAVELILSLAKLSTPKNEIVDELVHLGYDREFASRWISEIILNTFIYALGRHVGKKS